MIRHCIASFSKDGSKNFFLYNDSCFHDPQRVFRADLALSLDVIYHLVVEDRTFERYLHHLFSAADRFVIIYSTNSELSDPAPHVRHRGFPDWVSTQAPDWTSIRQIDNPFPTSSGEYESSDASFYIFAKHGAEQ